MKLTGNIKTEVIEVDTDHNLCLKPPRDRSRNKRSRQRRPVGAPSRWRSRPETPLLKWKLNESNLRNGVVEEVDIDGGGVRRIEKAVMAVSARKIAAGLWRLQAPVSERMRLDGLEFHKPCTSHVGFSFIPDHGGKAHAYGTKDTLASPISSSGAKNRSLHRYGPVFQLLCTGMEGATKWNPVCLETSDQAYQLYSHMKCLDEQVNTVALVSALESELGQARTLIQELEDERRSSKKKLEHFLKKVSEERTAWKSREHEKVRVFVDDIKAQLNRERKKCQKLEILNSKLVNELADVRVSAKKFMKDYGKERKSRVLIEEVCNELAKEIGEDKAEAEELKRETMKLRDELDEERRILQMSEVWREERVQMKLIDAKVVLEEKYSQMSKLVADLEAFLKSRNVTLDSEEMREADSLLQASSTITMQDMDEFKYEPPNSDDIFSILEVNPGEPNEREIDHCSVYGPVSHRSKVSSIVNLHSKNVYHRQADSLIDSDDIQDDESGWETVSHLEDQGSSKSPQWSEPSVNRDYRNSNVSGTGLDWEGVKCCESPMSEITEHHSMPTKHLKKASSIARLWKSHSNIGNNYKIITVDWINGRHSNARKSYGGIISADDRSSKGGHSPQDSTVQWSSPDCKMHDAQGRSCRAHDSLKSKLLEARIEGQKKTQLRHVLKQKS